MNRQTPIEIVLAARYVPDGRKVSKPTGQKLYAVKKHIEIYGSGGERIIEVPGCVYLVSDNGNIEQVSADMKVKLSTTVDELMLITSDNRFEDD